MKDPIGVCRMHLHILKVFWGCVLLVFLFLCIVGIMFYSLVLCFCLTGLIKQLKNVEIHTL
jgi:hypothetical protein